MKKYIISEEIKKSREDREGINKLLSNFNSLSSGISFLKESLIERISKSDFVFSSKIDSLLKRLSDGIDINNLPDVIKTSIEGRVRADVEFPDIQKVELIDKIKPPVINVEHKDINFPEVQKVQLVDKIEPPVINITEKNIDFPEVQTVKFNTDVIKVENDSVQKIDGEVSLKNNEFTFLESQLEKIKPLSKVEANVNFPDVQKVKVENQIEKVRITNLEDIKLDLPDTFTVNNIPTGRGKKLSKQADPEYYIPVRITDGYQWNDSVGGGTIMSNGGSVSGSSLPESWTTTSGTVLSTSTLILESNQMRKTAVITNDSDNIVYLSFGTDAKVGAGIRLNDGGGSYEINQQNMFKGNVFAISDGVFSNVCILQVSKDLS